MDNKQILKREDSENESVLYNSEDLVALFMGYYLLLGNDVTRTDLRNAREEYEYKVMEEVFSSCKDVTRSELREAIALTKYSEDAPIYKRYGKTPEEALNVFHSTLSRRAEDFIERRYPTFCSLFLNYLERLVLVGMRTGVLKNSWWRAYNYGFSVEPYPLKVEDNTPNAFPYTSVEEMTETDKRAYLWTVEDILYSIMGKTLCRTLRQPAKDEKEIDAIVEGKKRAIEPYPEGGYEAEEIAERASSKDYTVQVSELYESWEWDMELYLPIAIHRFDEAIYYAIKYAGAEYKEYIKSLNVEEDYNYCLGGFEAYSKAMEEGYVWHWVE